MNPLRFLLIGVASVAAMSAGAAQADVITIDDNVSVRCYQGTSTYNGSPCGSSGSRWIDQIGNSNVWQTTKIIATRTGTHVTFDIYTNKDNNTEDAISGHVIQYADFFLDLQPDNAITGPFQDWDIGLDLQTGNIYQLSNSDDWKTSVDLMKNTGLIYGGRIRNTACGGTDASDNDPDSCDTGNNEAGFLAATAVDINDATLLGSTTITHASVNQFGATHRISFTLTAANTQNNFNANNAFDVFWGTGECGNDSIWGAVPGAPQTPEPAALALFGLGMVGVCYGARRRRAAA